LCIGISGLDAKAYPKPPETARPKTRISTVISAR
jgi:hypothetical protein